MNNNTKKIKSFTDLNAWKEAHRLVLIIYKITKDFPKEEMFGLTSQIRRAAVSVTSNIAEGFSRQTYKDKIHFYFMAKGSLTELQNQLLIARDIDYIGNKDFVDIADQTVVTHKLLNGLIKKSKDIQNSKFKIQNSNNNGFTLIDLIVVMVIIGIMSAVVISGYSNQRDSKALSLGKKQVINDIRVTQEKTYNTLSVNGTSFPEGGYGIRFTDGSDKYIVFADNDNNGTYTDATENCEEIELPKNVRVNNLKKNEDGIISNLANVDVVFQPPYGKVLIDGKEKLNGNFINLEIEIKSQSGSTKVIEINSSRLIK